MERIIWVCLALILGLATLAIVRVGNRRRAPLLKQNTGHCARCQTPMSLRRVSIFEWHSFKVQWICPHCTTQTKSVKRLSGASA
jgi:hypothetical protein